jgi:hypothetical protein
MICEAYYNDMASFATSRLRQTHASDEKGELLSSHLQTEYVHEGMEGDTNISR